MQYKAYSLRNRKNGSRKDGGLYMSLRCSKPITSLSSNPPSPRIPVVPRVLESPRAPSIHTGGDSIMPWWKAMENQLGIQGRASTMHGHTARRRQAICCDEEALYTARLRSPSSPNEPSQTFPKPDTPAHQHTSNHRAAHAEVSMDCETFRVVCYLCSKTVWRYQRSLHMTCVWINISLAFTQQKIQPQSSLK